MQRKQGLTKIQLLALIDDYEANLPGKFEIPDYVDKLKEFIKEFVATKNNQDSIYYDDFEANISKMDKEAIEKADRATAELFKTFKNLTSTPDNAPLTMSGDTTSTEAVLTQTTSTATSSTVPTSTTPSSTVVSTTRPASTAAVDDLNLYDLNEEEEKLAEGVDMDVDTQKAIEVQLEEILIPQNKKLKIADDHNNDLTSDLSLLELFERDEGVYIIEQLSEKDIGMLSSTAKFFDNYFQNNRYWQGRMIALGLDANLLKEFEDTIEVANEAINKNKNEPQKKGFNRRSMFASLLAYKKAFEGRLPSSILELILLNGDIEIIKRIEKSDISFTYSKVIKSHVVNMPITALHLVLISKDLTAAKYLLTQMQDKHFQFKSTLPYKSVDHKNIDINLIIFVVRSGNLSALNLILAWYAERIKNGIKPNLTQFEKECVILLHARRDLVHRPYKEYEILSAAFQSGNLRMIEYVMELICSITKSSDKAAIDYSDNWAGYNCLVSAVKSGNIDAMLYVRERIFNYLGNSFLEETLRSRDINFVKRVFREIEGIHLLTSDFDKTKLSDFLTEDNIRKLLRITALEGNIQNVIPACEFFARLKSIAADIQRNRSKTNIPEISEAELKQHFLNDFTDVLIKDSLESKNMKGFIKALYLVFRINDYKFKEIKIPSKNVLMIALTIMSGAPKAYDFVVDKIAGELGKAGEKNAITSLSAIVSSAVASNNIEMLRKIYTVAIKNNMDVNFDSPIGSPLFSAINYNNVQAFDFLLSQSTTNLKATHENHNLLTYAIKHGKLAFVKVLLETRSKPGDPASEPLFKSDEAKQYIANNPDVLDAIIAKGTLADVRYAINTGLLNPKMVTDSGHNIFLLAAKYGKLDILKYAVNELKINPKSKTKNGETALHVLAQGPMLSSPCSNAKSGEAIQTVFAYLCEIKVPRTAKDGNGLSADDYLRKSLSHNRALVFTLIEILKTSGEKRSESQSQHEKAQPNEQALKRKH